jgi:hypothetical protein
MCISVGCTVYSIIMLQCTVQNIKFTKSSLLTVCHMNVLEVWNSADSFFVIF